MPEVSDFTSGTLRGQAASATHETAGWRSDVDGLRGFAVLLLLAVHMFPEWGRRGGLVGLDMLFVISGFLITRRLLSAHAAGRMDLPAFFVRRMQRIVPSLCLILMFCLAFSWLFTAPDATRQIGKQVASATLFASNLIGWREAALAGHEWQRAPLFHLWALAFLVQFCIVWPIVLAWLLRSGRSVVAAVCTLLLSTLLLDVTFSQSHREAALPASPAWEWMAGALLACMSAKGNAGPVAWIQARLVRHPRAQHLVPDLMAWAGVALLGASVMLISQSTDLPGWRSLLPALATFALLAAGSEAAFNRSVLSQPVLRFYGAISFPLYLWHWPLLTFPVVMGVPLTPELRVAILISSVVLAALTYELLDKPIESAAPSPRVLMLLVSALTFVGALGWAAAAPLPHSDARHSAVHQGLSETPGRVAPAFAMSQG